MILQVPAQITKVETTADRGVKLSIFTQELSPADAGTVFQLKDKYGYFLFKETQFEEKEVEALPDYVPIERNDKTPSQRLRAVLFVLWKQNGAQGDADSFYRQKMEEIISHFKKSLE